MVYHIIVSFGRERQYEFKFSHTELAVGSPEEARRWFDKEFADLECEPSNPMGKVLIIDKMTPTSRRSARTLTPRMTASAVLELTPFRASSWTGAAVRDDMARSI